MNESVLQIDAGNAFLDVNHFVPQLTDLEKASALVLAKSAAKLKVDAQNVGVMDLSAGLDFVKELQEKAKEKGQLSLISSNLADKQTHKPVFDTEKVVEVNGVKFGIFGLIRPNRAVPPKLEVLDAFTVAEDMVKKLRMEKKADLVIGLFNYDMDQTKAICAKVPGIDIVVMSGTGEYLVKPALAGGTLLLQSGSGGKYLGQLQITYRPERRDGNNKAEVKKLQRELDGLDSQMSGLERHFQDKPEAGNKFQELQAQRDQMEADLEKISLAFDYTQILVPMDAVLLQDAEIMKWTIPVIRAQAPH